MEVARCVQVSLGVFSERSAGICRHVPCVSWQRAPDGFVGQVWSTRRRSWYGKPPRRLRALRDVATARAVPRCSLNSPGTNDRSLRLWRALPFARLAGDAARGRYPVGSRSSSRGRGASFTLSFSALLISPSSNATWSSIVRTRHSIAWPCSLRFF